MDSDKELLNIGGIVRKLYEVAALEQSHDRYNRGKYDAYFTIFEVIQKTLKLDFTEFNRRIDELYISEVLNLLSDGDYQLICREGRITIKGQ